MKRACLVAGEVVLTRVVSTARGNTPALHAHDHRQRVESCRHERQKIYATLLHSTPMITDSR